MAISFGFDLASLGSSLITQTWHLQRSYNWGLLMPSNFNGVIGYLVSQFCQDINFGDYSMSELSSLKVGATTRFYAGAQNIQEITLEFLVPVDNSVLDYFYAWYEKMIDNKGYYHPKKEYKRNIFIMLYDQTKIEVSRFELQGCFPKSHPKIHPSYKEDNVMMADITLSVDTVKPSSLIGGIRSGVAGAIGKAFGK